MIRGSLIIPSLDRHAILRETVERFLAFPFDAWELIVVDQTAVAAPFMQTWQQQRPHQIRYLRIEARGLPDARNAGIAVARGEIILFVDDDVVPEEGLLDAHLRTFDEKSIGGVAGRVIEAVTRPRTLAPGAVIGRVRRLDGHIVRGFDSQREMDVDHAPGGNMSWRREALVAAGGFDRRFGGTAHLEESDLSVRVRALGWRIRFVPAAGLTHLSLQSGGCRELDMDHWFYWYGHNYLLFARKNLPAASFPVFLAARLVKLLFTAVRHQRLAYLIRGVHGLVDGWRTCRRPADLLPGSSGAQPPP